MRANDHQRLAAWPYHQTSAYSENKLLETLLTFGPEVEVLEPLTLREDLEEDVEAEFEVV
jgi:predicted DNA-binding transcriptional regulator YafY